MFEFLAGILLMFAVLAAVGFTRGRWLSQKRWVAVWFSVSASLAVGMVGAFLLWSGISEVFYGLGAGYVLGVTIHTYHHALDELRRKPSIPNP